MDRKEAKRLAEIVKFHSQNLVRELSKPEPNEQRIRQEALSLSEYEGRLMQALGLGLFW